MADKTPWHIKGDYFEACSCDLGCPCNFNGFPTKGFCEANVGFKITQGNHGDTKLDGLAVFTAVKWPGAIHEGNGTLAAFIDEGATEEQRSALVRILTAQDGGMPWEIFASTVTDIKGPFFVPIKFEVNGTKTKASVDGAEVELETFTNPVTGEDHEVHTVIPGGFVWTDAEVCKTAKNVAKVDGIEFDWSGQNGYYAKVDWSNAETHEGAKTKFEH